MPKNNPHDVFKHIDMTKGRDSCWLWKGRVASNGRPYFTLEGKKVLAYRLAKKLITGIELQQGEVERHTCDNPICCNPNHLITGTHQENMNDMKGRERHGLPHHVVKAIRRLLDANRTQQEIADLYGVSRETISAIATRRVYSHVNSGRDQRPDDESGEA